MPFNGQSPFLQKETNPQKLMKSVCQCPSTGNLHFYDCFQLSWMQHVMCVNALQRAISISTVLVYCWNPVCSMCQCPSTGNLHFYKGNMETQHEIFGVSMPFNGQSPFLQGKHHVKIQTIICVNALQRAISISTILLGWNICTWLLVSMPFNGQSPFLQEILEDIINTIIRVNALQRAISISTLYQIN